MSRKYICVEGNIGAGKTTFVKTFAQTTGYTPIFERFSENPFLKLFYQNPKKHAFPLEMSFLAERFQQLNDVFSKPDLFQDNHIADYSFLKTLIFAEINLLPEEFQIFRSFHKILSQSLVPPDCIVYLDTNLEYLENNIERRKRAMEQGIERNYLNDISLGYKRWLLHSRQTPLIIIPYSATVWPNMAQLTKELHEFINGQITLPNRTVWK